jgi:putative SOS response-associated peptidase YedK
MAEVVDTSLAGSCAGSSDELETRLTIVATAPSRFVAQRHDRMSLILEPDTWDARPLGDPNSAAATMKPTRDIDQPACEACGTCE